MFGPKILISVAGRRFAFLNRLSFNPYNEGEDLKAQAQAYSCRYGCCPEATYADQIYRSTLNRVFCRLHIILLSSLHLGHSKNDPQLVRAEKRQFVDGHSQPNAVEGKIVQGKRRYGLGLIREKLPAKQGSSTAMNVLVINLQNLPEQGLRITPWLLRSVHSGAPFPRRTISVSPN